MTTPRDFYSALLDRLSAPTSEVSIAICDEWARLEGMYNPAGLSFDRGFNPWMTTWPDSPDTHRSNEDIGFGPGKWNNANPPLGVGMYATMADGVEATYRTLARDLRFQPIIRAFREQSWNSDLEGAWQTWIGSPGYASSLSAFAAQQWSGPRAPSTDSSLTTRLAAIEQALGGPDRIASWNARGNDLLAGFTTGQEFQQQLANQLLALAQRPSVGGISRADIVAGLQRIIVAIQAAIEGLREE